MEGPDSLHDGTITRIEPQARRKSRLSIFLDGEFAFGLNAEVVLRHALKPGDVLPVALQERLLFEEDSKGALTRAFALLGRRALTEHELRSKLKALEFHEQIVDRVVARCRELGYLDDEKFAHDFIRAQLARRPLGSERLRLALRRKGVPANLIEVVLAEAVPAGSTSLVEAAAQKFLARRGGTLPAPKLRQRLTDHLRRAGFSWEEIQNALAWPDEQGD